MKFLIRLSIFFLAINLSIGQEAGWHLKDVNKDNAIGISAASLYTDVLSNHTSKTVVVAVIDSGVDIEHEDLSPNVWINHDEIPGNGVDDDNNGYIDDINGWNFIGGADGRNVSHDTYEATRIYAKYKYKYDKANPKLLSKKNKQEYDLYIKCRDEVESKLTQAKDNLDKVLNAIAAYKNGLESVDKVLGGKKVTQENLNKIDVTDDFILEIGKDILMQQITYGYEIENIEEFKNAVIEQLESDRKYYQVKVDYAYNIDFDSRKIVGDDYSNAEERYYGNPDVEGPDAMHGTHVAGIIAAVRGNELGMDGVANNVRIMSVRTVPDGDERDKDVANAIRYAVDNGASIINMSFGKGYAWNEKVVEKAIKYAEKNDVLLVHGSGNDGNNIDETDNFPNDTYKTKGFLFFKGKTKEFKNWIEVGASSYDPDVYLAAPFSNYGIEEVDIFAPGMEIYSTVPDNKYQPLQGTSMAAPVVAGVATVLRSYFPSLTAEQVKNILMASSVKKHEDVILPGTKDQMIPFSKLSVSGGIVNAEKAVKLAMITKGKKKVKKEVSWDKKA